MAAGLNRVGSLKSVPAVVLVPGGHIHRACNVLACCVDYLKQGLGRGGERGGDGLGAVNCVAEFVVYLLDLGPAVLRCRCN